MFAGGLICFVLAAYAGPFPQKSSSPDRSNTEDPGAPLEVSAQAFRLIYSDYVDQIVSRDLVHGAIGGTQDTVASHGSLPPPGPLDTIESTAKPDDPESQLKVFSEAFRLIHSQYGDQVSARDLAHAAIRGMLKAVDPQGSFLPPDIFKEMQVETQQTHSGVGLEITMQENQLTVVAPIAGAPADRMGAQAGDRILKIDGQPTKKMSLMEVVRKLRGPQGTRLTLTIQRGDQEPFDLTMTREPIVVKSVRAQDLGEGIGYVRVSRFQDRTSQDLQSALSQLRQNGMTALVLDLRNNPGGLLNQAVRVTELFLNPGELVVSTSGRAKGQTLRLVAKAPNGLPKFPMVVLVNRGSAAGSEIVAGALQDRNRALIVGTPTFGRGSIQTVIPLADGSGFGLTTARFFTPKGRSIQDKGIMPDVIVEEPQPQREQVPHSRRHQQGLGDLKSDIPLQRAVELLKARMR